jgi:hypothetical protein
MHCKVFRKYSGIDYDRLVRMDRMMFSRRIFFFTALSFFILVSSYTQVKSLPEVFMENFKKATLEVKLEVVKDALALKVEGMDAFFSTGLRYCVDNYKIENKNATFREMLQICIDQVRDRKYKSAVADLIDLYQLELDTLFKIAIMDALADISPGDPLVVKAMNRSLSIQNESYRVAKTYDPQLVAQTLRNLGNMGDPSSFAQILISIILRYSNDTTLLAEEALRKLPGDLRTEYIDFILEEQFFDKLAAFRRAIAEETLSIEDKSAIAEFALNISIHLAGVSADYKINAGELRNASLDFLALNHWSHAADVLIENFNIAVGDFDKKLAGKTVVLKAIDALGNMRSHEAANRLVLYLEYVNSYTERGKPYDEEIVGHVIAALKQLGDIVAQQALLYTRYLNYSDVLKRSAFEAYQSLK